MIYVSSSCVKFPKISDSVKFLAENGFQNIELSGGTTLYPDLENNLLELKEKHELNLLCHNYFPPPEKDFVLNLASLNDEISEMSRDHVIKALRLSKSLDADKYAFHAGFLLDIPLSEIGLKVKRRSLFDRAKAIERFAENFNYVMKEAEVCGVKAYVENNVLSLQNFEEYNKVNPFLFTDSSTMTELERLNGFTPLIDLAHLKVSCNSLGLDFKDQASQLCDQTDYIHLSDNDGLTDSNGTLNSDSEIFGFLKGSKLKDRDFTLEVYSSFDDLKSSYNLINDLMR